MVTTRDGWQGQRLGPAPFWRALAVVVLGAALFACSSGSGSSSDTSAHSSADMSEVPRILPSGPPAGWQLVSATDGVPGSPPGAVTDPRSGTIAAWTDDASNTPSPDSTLIVVSSLPPRVFHLGPGEVRLIEGAGDDPVKWATVEMDDAAVQVTGRNVDGEQLTGLATDIRDSGDLTASPGPTYRDLLDQRAVVRGASSSPFELTRPGPGDPGYELDLGEHGISGQVIVSGRGLAPLWAAHLSPGIAETTTVGDRIAWVPRWSRPGDDLTGVATAGSSMLLIDWGGAVVVQISAPDAEQARQIAEGLDEVDQTEWDAFVAAAN